jgi:hypothetical protein
MKKIFELLDKYNEKTGTVLNHIVLFSYKSGEFRDEENKLLLTFDRISQLKKFLKKIN